MSQTQQLGRQSSTTTMTPPISINDGNLVVHGRTILTGVPDNIVLTPGKGVGLVAGAFIGATVSQGRRDHRTTVVLGPSCFLISIVVMIDRGLRFMCCFRFKLWWMTQRMETSGKDVPLETQFMLVESKGGGEGDEEEDSSPTIYTVFLPLLEGLFRSVLQGNERNEVEICLESGDSAVQINQGQCLVYMHAGTNPFEVITQALPSFLDWFGWCTWDTFYTDVTSEGVEHGLESLSKGGTPPRFLIIDDGWRQIEKTDKDSNVVVQEGAQFASRLTGIKENEKFQKNDHNSEQVSGLKHVVDVAKQHHNVKFVYVWHALAGYWGGVKPAATGMEHHDTALAYPVTCPGVEGNQPDIVMDSLLLCGSKVFNFYNELHSYLASCGVDGVKVDVQNIIETLGAGHGGRVSLTHSYHRALEASVARNFPDNGCIACMCHNTDGLYSAKETAVVRASDDLYPSDPANHTHTLTPASHTIRISSVADNTLFLGEFVHPDWDMFHSVHLAAEYHGAAHAVGGCAIYVSDKPGNHNFDLLRKLVLPDGSVLRAKLPGRPTRDCLFADPARDRTSLLKIWNVNNCSGVIGVFNCQGAGWCKIEKKTRIHDNSPGTLSGSVCATDVDAIAQVAGADWNGETVVYAHKSGEVLRLPKGASVPVTLKVLEYEVFQFCPLKKITSDISFTPIGPLDMFNSSAAVEQVEIHLASDKKPELFDREVSENRSPTATIGLKTRGCGRFGAYSSQHPLKCTVDNTETNFECDAASGLMKITIPVSEKEMYRWSVEIQV
ncbi:unnamed protein product [Malus baccata var. baccata]